MNKRTLAALGAIFGSLMLVLGLQQAVVLTSAAWTDSVNFSAPATSGTWAVAQAQLRLDVGTVASDSGPVMILRVQVANQKPNTSSGAPVNTLSLKATVPTAALGNQALMTIPSGWSLFGTPVTSGANQIFEFRRTTTIAVYGDTGTVEFKLPLACKKGDKVPASIEITSPEAVNTLNFSGDAHILGWQC
ncbi:hypothetical protein [Microterricola viridarii]|uniref:Uncharacterized protein n=1 Tax=Microterricola viridarii TaxID=412690 RepID=A0A1H1Z2C5_9MICO|nr:hypothetical protein [Microterricola viridarii]SDT27894.1 hypothetical protein SAMN04489834_3291 [Microterricola viridarii]